MAKGRPSSYKPEFAEQARKLCLLGATDIELADFFDVASSTFYKWKLDYPDLAEALKTGKDTADERVERSLYHKAIGYTFHSEKIFHDKGTITRAPCIEHVAPDTVACIFWLKNRRSNEWRDVHKIEHGKPGDFSGMTDDELNTFIANGQRAISQSNSGEEKARGDKGSSRSRRLN